VISTSVGAEGLPVRHGEHLLIADTDEEFAAACVRLIQHPDEAARLVAAGYRVVREIDQQATDRVRSMFSEAATALARG
jgi:hypothetical protein